MERQNSLLENAAQLHECSGQAGTGGERKGEHEGTEIDQIKVRQSYESLLMEGSAAPADGAFS